MAVDSFIYQGIDRAVSDFTGARSCEELINLRPTEGGLVPVKDFAAKYSNVDWDKVFVHYTTSGPRYIVVKHTSTAVEVYYLQDETDPTSLVSLFSVETSDAQDVIDHLYFAAAGNVVLFSICAEAAGKYENHAFTWKMDDSTTPPAERYVGMDGSVPPVSYELTEEKYDTYSYLFTPWQAIARISKDSSASECEEAVQAGLNAIQEENPDTCFGPIIIAVAYKTTDGNTFWTGGWRVYDPIETIKDDTNSTYRDAESEPAELYAPFFEKYGYGYLAMMTGDGATSVNEIFVAGTKVSLEFAKLTAGSWDKDSSIIQSVEVYCSKPISYIDASGAKDGLFELDETHHGYHLYLPGVKYADMDLGGQLLYHQASVSMASLAESAQTVKLTFGGNIQVTEETLGTDAGALERYGRLLSYNARFHYFDSVSKIRIGMPSFNFEGVSIPVTPDVFVRYADDDQTGLVYLGPGEPGTGDGSGAYSVIAPSINIKEVIEYFSYGGSYYARTYRMTPSTSYNFSICIGGGTVNGPLSTPVAELEAAKSDPAGNIVTNVEPDAINVTEQYSPFVFRVEHSYKAPGNIIDVQPQMAGVVDASYGRDPLNVFTERGLYALTQGSANVLYGAFLPLSNLKAQRGGIPVEAGTFFLADGALWLVSGRRVTLISEALSEGPHKYIRACHGYRRLSGTDTDFSLDGSPVTPVADPFYDVSPYLSKVEFKDFADGGQLSYNRYRMELFVSNPDYSYTYVLSLKNSQWYKLSKRLWQDEPGSTVINQPGTTAGTITLLDMSRELSDNDDNLLIHFQSRPFSMGYQYSHVHRIITMMRAKLGDPDQKVATALYGSDDLQHWSLLSYGTWSGRTEYNPTSEEYEDIPLFLSQLRTPSAARSWRYYTICAGGEIPTDPDFPTDIGPTLVDYRPVNRRLG